MRVPSLKSCLRIALALLALLALTMSLPFVYLAFRISIQRRELQERTDFAQIALACASLAESATDETLLLRPSHPTIPPTLRRLPWRYIAANSNAITMEFHGGFDHYGYRVVRSESNAALWTLSWYTENGSRVLVTVQP